MKILLIALLLVVTGCVTREKCWERYPPQTHDSLTYIEKIRDTTIFITDSAGITALLECDSLGKVRIKAIQDMYAGQFVTPKVIIKNNYLTAKCVIDSGAVYATMKDRYKEKVKTITIVTPPTNILTSWQAFQMWTGRILLACAALFLLIRYILPLVRKALIKV